MVVYADVLIILNLYINFFLIKSTALITRRDISAKRCVAAALIGALGALVILLPELPFLVTMLIKLAMGALITFAAFGKQNPSDFAVCALFFLVISFTYAGIMMALWTFAAPFGMVWSNGTAYFDIPIAALALFTAAAYLIVKLARTFSDNRLHCNKLCRVKIAANGAEATLSGLSDTGNEACDVFSGKPVLICELSKALPVIPSDIRDYLGGKTPEGIRLIPCSTVTGNSLIPVFKPDSVTIDGKEAHALIGVSQNRLGHSVDCIFNPKIISI